MHSEPTDLDRVALADALHRHWAIETRELEYLAVGFGCHHWRAGAAGGSRWFVTAHDLLAGRNAGRAPEDVIADLDRAFRTAAALRDDAGLDFVLAPVVGDEGAVVRLDARYAIRVEPYSVGTSSPIGEFAESDDRRRVATLVGRLHASSARIPPDLARREDFGLQGRAELETALGDLGSSWSGGPFAQPAHDLLQTHAADVRRRLRDQDLLASQLLGTASASWVVTHGEPHSANVIREPGGGLRLVDWDTVLTGPPERDLWMVLDDGLAGWEEYCEAAGATQLDDRAMSLYRERWALSEICEYIAAFRRPHDDTADTREAWAELGEYLP